MTDDNRLRSAFLSKQNHLLAALEIVPDLTGHGTTIGDDSEANWSRVLREFLPARYGIAKGQVMDAQGGISDQIDLLIYDAQYTPLLAKTANGDMFVPAEAVYAVFEVKQEINKEFLKYAGNKIASVRKLNRTTVHIPHAGGTYAPKQPIPILGGLLTTRSGWANLEGRAAVNAILGLIGDRRVDIGCALRGVAFNRTDQDLTNELEYSEPDMTLMFFLVRLFSRLQKVGTVAAVDIDAYMNALDLSDEPFSDTAPTSPEAGSGDRL
ncbi:DUF6602 domain-containing protein [Arthrobacter psychrochitiniphilus]|uniref:DUF6602 domain-containing protein n=1 Tax=Arthrobacter psychrochitiniphilus TaxID=291045 RepID=A0A2V3DM05_9MICC|nr:DUF6602 domain-containing protein [Arthrobacter psychrochitiniphilus]NYG16100.1 hypothetical protein [Arthrobacter psychrochitiniphilus]PXA63940.1 hypothetical protein CVS29_17655 [Arthrobacter psychrochitiniphilus]